MEITILMGRLATFARERDWEQFHTPKNLLLALVGEVGELAELMQWRSDADVVAGMDDAEYRVDMERELADIVIYLVRLADVLGIDLDLAVLNKIAENERKYPAEVVRGSSRKYTQYTQGSTSGPDVEGTGE